MDNQITIDIETIKLAPDNSIIDAETIRQIALYSIANNDTVITRKIKKGFEFAGLYPHVVKTYNIVPDDSVNVELLKTAQELRKQYKPHTGVYGILDALCDAKKNLEQKIQTLTSNNDVPAPGGLSKEELLMQLQNIDAQIKEERLK